MLSQCFTSKFIYKPAIDLNATKTQLKYRSLVKLVTLPLRGSFVNYVTLLWPKFTPSPPPPLLQNAEITILITIGLFVTQVITLFLQ